MKLIRVGVDLAKNVFQVHGVDRSETSNDISAFSINRCRCERGRPSH